MAISPNNSPQLRVMVDTSIFISGTVWPRWPHEVLSHAIRNDFTLVLSPYGKYEALKKFRQKYSPYLDIFLQFLTTCPYEEVDSPSREEVHANQSLMTDMKDIPTALAAINAHVDCLVSEDKHFTDNDTLQKKLNVALSGTFLREYMGWTSDELEAIHHRTWNDLTKRTAA